MTDKIVVLVTAGSQQEAQKIAEHLVKEKLAACVNIVNDIESIFSWQGRVSKESEVLLVAKSVTGNFEKLVAIVESLHSYDVPEIIALPIIAGSSGYLNWVDQETKPAEGV